VTQLTDFAYAQARQQARHGALPSPTLWQRLEASASLAHFLQSARKSVVRPWLYNIGPHSRAVEIELALRAELRHQIEAVAAWQPRPWRAAALWTRVLCNLPAVDHLLRGEPARPWMREDRWLQPLALDAPVTARVQGLAETPYAPLGGAHPANGDLAGAWVDHWRSLWPAASPSERRSLETLVSLVAEHYRVLASGEAIGSARAREALESRLRRAVRHHTHEPAAAYLHLALVALNLERLRGALIRRQLFPPTRPERAA
jgi:hypothetical protein